MTHDTLTLSQHADMKLFSRVIGVYLPGLRGWLEWRAED